MEYSCLLCLTVVKRRHWSYYRTLHLLKPLLRFLSSQHETFLKSSRCNLNILLSPDVNHFLCADFNPSKMHLILYKLAHIYIVLVSPAIFLLTFYKLATVNVHVTLLVSGLCFSQVTYCCTPFSAPAPKFENTDFFNN